MAHKIESAGMKEKDRSILEDNEQDIIELMDPDNVSNILVRSHTIDSSDSDKIKSGKNITEKSRILLGTLMTRGPNAYNSLIEALRKTNTANHIKLADILQSRDSAPTVNPADDMIDKSRYERLSEHINDHAHRLKQLERSMREVTDKEQMEELQRNLATTQAELEDLRQEVLLKECENQDLREQLERLRKQYTDLQIEMATKVGDLKNENKELRSLVEDERRNRILNSERVDRQMHELRDLVNARTTRGRQLPPIEPRNRFQGEGTTRTRGVGSRASRSFRAGQRR